ncbi:hypothetical protein YC2023_052745 [Brassica napus]
MEGSFFPSRPTNLTHTLRFVLNHIIPFSQREQREHPPPHTHKTLDQSTYP